MMIKDYHIHAQILQHPETFTDFVNVAIANNIEEICITDHMPLVGSNAADRIPNGKVKEYCHRVREMQEKYADKISILCGIEIDYHPTIQAEIEAVLQDGEFDFVLGSSHLHALSNNIFHTITERNDYARAMFENTIAAAKTGYFHAIAHLDMHRWIFANPHRFPLADDNYTEEKHNELIDKTLDTICSRGLKLEINPHFAMASNNTNNVYPSASIVQKALNKGINFTYGSDAHVSQDVGCMLETLRKHPVYGPALNTWERD